jgi:hypothetical protein
MWITLVDNFRNDAGLKTGVWAGQSAGGAGKARVG